MIDEYVGTLEKLLGVQKTEFSIADRWSQCPPPEADGKPIKEFLNTVRLPNSCGDSRSHVYRLHSTPSIGTATTSLIGFERTTIRNSARTYMLGFT